MQHEGVARLVLIATIDDRAAQLYLMVEHLFPLLVGKLLALHQVGSLTEVEDRDERTGNACSIRRRLIGIVVHQHRLTAIAHQPGNVVVRHIEPVELPGRQRLEVNLRLAVVVLVGGIPYRLANDVQRPLEEVHHLRHSRSHTTSERLVTRNLRTVLLIFTSLVPLRIHQRNEFRTLGSRPASGSHTLDSITVGWHVLQRIGHLGIVVEEPLHIIRSLRQVEITALGIAQHLRHEVVAGNHHETTVVHGIKHIIGTFCLVRGTTRVDLLELLARHKLLGLLECLCLADFLCMNRHTAHQGSKH